MVLRNTDREKNQRIFLQAIPTLPASSFKNIFRQIFENVGVYQSNASIWGILMFESGTALDLYFIFFIFHSEFIPKLVFAILKHLEKTLA